MCIRDRDDGHPPFQVELCHEVVLAAMEVDGSRMEEREGRLRLLAANDAAGLFVDDGELVGRGGTQAYLAGRVAAAGHEPGVEAPPQAALGRRALRGLLQAGPEELRVVRPVSYTHLTLPTILRV